METPKIKISRLRPIVNKRHSMSPMRIMTNISSPNDKRFVKCSSERKDLKRLQMSPNTQLCRSSNKKQNWFKSRVNQTIKTPQARRTLNFENLSPANNNYNSISSNENVLPSVDTPERKTILEKGISNSKKNWPIVGHGCFGVVIKARYKGESVAVKVVKKNEDMKDDTLLKEMNGIHLNHRNVINIIKVVLELDTNYGLVIMELWDTINMQQMIDHSQSKISFFVKLRYIMNLCEALQHCHDNRVVHLDVKPKNILVSQRGSNHFCKLCDFGSSVLLDNSDTTNNYHFSHHQGTIKYMAPELLCGGTISVKADVFSLGITMWQLLHEETPYDGEALDAIIYRVVSQNYRPKMYETYTEVENLFVGLHKICWQQNQAMRPDLLTIILNLKEIMCNTNNFGPT